MRVNQLVGAGLLALTLVLSQTTFADQLEKETNEAALKAPRGFLVKVNPETKTVEVFRATTLDSKIIGKTASVSETESAVNLIESAKNKIAEYKLSTNELDKDSSTESWWYRGYGYGYRWNNWGGYRPYYYNWSTPYYNAGYFNYGYNNYRYNYNWNYSYNNCNYGWYY